jgi:predicted DCC family thiol-disulfide oxidoreductase YuxK
MGWTGVQYSIFRIGLAIAVAHVCVSRLAVVEGPVWAFLSLGAIGAFALAFGWRDRAVTLNLIAMVGGLCSLVDGAPLVIPSPDVVLTTSLLVFHLFSPVTPFGSWDARERVDPRGDWFRPEWIGHAAWVWLAAVHLDRGLIHWGIAARTTAEFDLTFFSGASALLSVLFAITVFRVTWRAPAWVAMTLSQIAWFAAFGLEPGDGALMLLYFFAADPGWWPGRGLHPVPGSRNQPARLFYDGDCGFCHRAVRFVLSEELGTPASLQLRFAPLQSDLFSESMNTRDDIDPDALPDSIVLVLEDGTLLIQSAAALEIASRLGGLWRGVALFGNLFPDRLLDGGYDLIASVRKHLFAEPKGACPILPPKMRARFDL